jgi:hypothetical protein
MVLSEIKGQNCLGKLLRETGHNRVPDPPDRITGTICLTASGGMNVPLRNVAEKLSGGVSPLSSLIRNRSNQRSGAEPVPTPAAGFGLFAGPALANESNFLLYILFFDKRRLLASHASDLV